MRQYRLHYSFAALVAGLLLSALAADTKPDFSTAGPKSPREELATFRLVKGFRAELVACEPAVIDPVAMAFDEEGRLYVAEMRGYPNAGIATGNIHSGKIKLLEDRDGDGYYEHVTTFAEGLRFPTSVMPWKDGLLVAVAPDLVFFQDSDGDGKADKQRSLYTGFDLDNIQQLVNSLQWGLDNWVHGCAGNKGGDVRSVEKRDAPAVPLRGRGIRFHPESPGSLEPTSGGGQFGLTCDDWGQWFTATNSHHLRHLVIPDHYLRRSPGLAVSATTLDVPDHGAVCKLFRISPFEGWRVERTRRRAGVPDANKRFVPTELIAGGFVTSSTSPIVYNAGLFPESVRGQTFVCDPANNVIHRDRLELSGATFVAKRVDEDCEFFASTDNWCRPVNLTVGPDGALYVADFYREVIETPLSLPDDIKAKLNLESRSRGRIWRIVPEGAKPAKKPQLRKASTAELVAHLADADSWWRLTSQRLLVERQDKAAVALLEKLALETTVPVSRAHALWTLQGLNALSVGLIEAALQDPSAGVREQALRLAETRLASSPRLGALVLAMTNDSSPRVRYQLAFTLGELDSTKVAAALATIAGKDGADPWTQTAVLSSAGRIAPELLELLTGDRQFVTNSTAAHHQLLRRLAALIGTGAQSAEVTRALTLLDGDQPQAWQLAVLEGLGQGLQNSRTPLSRLWDDAPADLRPAIERTRRFFTKAAAAARDSASGDRLAAVRLLGYGPFAIAEPAFQALLTPQTPAEVQLAAVRALSQHAGPRVAEMLLAPWNGYGPTLRREVLEAIFARADRLPALLNAIAQKQILPNQLDPFRVEQLRKHPNAKLRARAQQLFTAQVSDRHKVVEQYTSALKLAGDAVRGKVVFQKTCSTCHRLENVGTEVGPDLLSALRNKTPETLLNDLFDPSREVDPRYVNYIVTMKSGQVFTGMIASETASSVTLRRAERAEDTVLRAQIEEIQGTAKSLMPENLETQLGKQDVADVIAYLLSAAAPK